LSDKKRQNEQQVEIKDETDKGRARDADRVTATQRERERSRPTHTFAGEGDRVSERFKVCVLLCFIKPILGNRYGPGVSSRASQGIRTHD